MPIRKLIVAAVAAALVLSAPVPSHADEFPNGQSSNFNGGAGGWDGDVSYAGLCIPTLTCPAAATSYVATGGADGGGYVRSDFGSVASTAVGTSIATWESPAFVYHGFAGEEPARVTFDMNLLRQMGALLNLNVDNSSDYQVDLVEAGNGTVVNVVPSTRVQPTNAGWSAIQSASVNPALLKVGRSYAVRITSRYNVLVAVVGTGFLGFDNVRLTTYDEKGDRGDGANGGSGITEIKHLRKLTKTFILPKSAKVSGVFLKMKLRCPTVAAPKHCKIQVQGLQGSKFSKPATAKKYVTVRPGKTRKVKIRIKPAYRAAYQNATKVWVKSSVRVGTVKVTVRKRIKLT